MSELFWGSVAASGVFTWKYRPGGLRDRRLSVESPARRSGDEATCRHCLQIL